MIFKVLIVGQNLHENMAEPVTNYTAHVVLSSIILTFTPSKTSLGRGLARNSFLTGSSSDFFAFSSTVSVGAMGWVRGFLLIFGTPS